MSKKYKILDANQNKETHTCYVKKRTPYGIFSASVICCKQDQDIENLWDGCTFAEMKCDMQSLKKELKAKKRERIGAEHLLSSLYYNGFYKDEADRDRIKQYGLKYLHNLDEEIQEINKTLKYGINNFEKITDNYLNDKRKFRKEVEARRKILADS